MLKVIADDREEGKGVIEALRRLKVEVEVKRLPVGDYLVSDEIVIERKTANDLINSIIDKRLFKQITYMRRYYSSPIFVLEGDLDSVLEVRLVKKQQVLGALASLALMGVPIVYT
ncbi:MAG TPA: DEAD/DEAH box helicase, partial [Thermoprotei archaeon]|nr:DEAD/DEAH box helicase [Thermoprotei archaeon]